jgi:transcriptional regulator with XRE-family HTH domain
MGISRKEKLDHEQASLVKQRAAEHLSHPIDDVERGRVLGLTRELLDLSQEELAQRAGVERSWLALTELGRTRITGPHVHASVQRKLDRIEAVLEHRRAEKDAEHWASNQFETLNHASVLEGDLTHDSLLTVQDEIIEAQDQLIHRLRERLAFKDKEVAEKNVGVRILEERLLELHAKRRSFSAR